jgi:hypothetical protein
MKYKTFTDLPNHIRRRVEVVAPSTDLQHWVMERIPALGNRSVLDVMNEDGDAEEKVLQFLVKVEGYFT